ncbi:hypothetical protein [Streptomyces sp. OE57]|uniref:hypothetical protein n=1 Tax=Streptomyces lacaronensis TaxID=3379885 RepID=UPI0039B783F1
MTEIPGIPWPWPWPDYEPNPQPVKAWVQYEDGSLGSLIVTGGNLPELSRPGRIITEDEYNRLTAAIAEAHTARLEAMAEEEAARQEREYQDLTAAGVPEPTARSLSGYTGPAATSSTSSA